MNKRSLTLGLLAAVASACGPREATQIRLTGIVQSDPIVVRAPVGGRLVETMFKEGQELQADQPLTSLDPSAVLSDIKLLEAEIAVLEARSRAGRTLAELEIERARDAAADAATRLSIAANQRDRASKTVAEHDRNPPDRRRRVEAGRVVEERDQLGRLEAEWADARLSYFQLQTAAAEYAARQADTARQSAEVRAGSMPDPLAAELLEYRSRLDEARRALRDHTIRAPAQGVAAVKVRSAGESVMRGDPVAVLYDPRHLWVGVTVEESLVAGIHEGEAVEVELPDGRLAQAAVESVSPAASFATQRDVDRVRRDIRAFRLKLQLPEGSGARPGMTAYVRIEQ